MIAPTREKARAMTKALVTVQKLVRANEGEADEKRGRGESVEDRVYGGEKAYCALVAAAGWI